MTGAACLVKEQMEVETVYLNSNRFDLFEHLLAKHWDENIKFMKYVAKLILEMLSPLIVF